MRIVLTGFFVALLLSGCMSFEKSGTISGLSVQKGAPVVYIHPLENVYSHATVGVLPFQVPANMSGEQGLGVGALFKDVLLARRVFETVRELDAPYNNLDSALAVGRKAGVDLVLAGKINYALEGTELGGGRVDVSVRFLNTTTGNTVWYVQQTMDQPVDYPDVGFVNRLLGSFSRPPVREPREAPSVTNLLARIAVDMADVLEGARAVKR
ncbi:hypothetical protein ACFL6N_02035 [Thermodesulfobacteriota bacterium]